jgi:hypothetical protein
MENKTKTILIAIFILLTTVISTYLVGYDTATKIINVEEAECPQDSSCIREPYRHNMMVILDVLLVPRIVLFLIICMYVTIELPGAEKDNIELNLEDDYLEVKAEQSEEK